jgi:hypothetical protein
LVSGVLKINSTFTGEVEKLIANREHPLPKDIDPLLCAPYKHQN